MFVIEYMHSIDNINFGFIFEVDLLMNEYDNNKFSMVSKLLEKHEIFSCAYYKLNPHSLFRNNLLYLEQSFAHIFTRHKYLLLRVPSGIVS